MTRERWEQILFAHVGDEVVQDMLNQYVLELESSNAKLRDDLEFERSENGWAREFLNRMGQKCGTKDCPSLVAYVTKLESENAKLRELCKDMMAFVEDDDACEHCRHDAECVEAADGELVLPYESRCLMLGLFADRMRELVADA